jgi:predicted CXXCH cytochrome family protein
MAMAMEVDVKARLVRITHAPRRTRGVWLALAFVGAVTVLAACTDTEVVFRDREIFNPPPDATFNFLGYFDRDAKLTACGNCHVGQQAAWEQTGHADAWAGLQASGGAQVFCEGCHTISELGNALAEPAGYNLVADEAYEDVQCESCHGSGYEHVQDPDATQPLAPMSVGAGLTTGCGECHSGAHHPFVEQWEESAHALTPAWQASSSTSTTPSCMECHEGKTAMAVKFLETDNYIEKNNGQPEHIVCIVCHDPHGSPNDANLRAPINVASTQHLCVTCHARRGTPWSSHGPHAAQGLLVLGQNVGYIPTGFVYDTAAIASTHGSTANTKLCATCHVNFFDVTDPATGDFLLTSVGHTFEAIPCLDAQGQPTSGPCADNQRQYVACTGAGCHVGATNAQMAARFGTLRSEIEFLLDQLWFDTDANHVMDATDAGALPQVVAQGDPTQFDPSGSAPMTVAKGAIWNAFLAYTHTRDFWEGFDVFGQHIGTHKASGEGVHNPFLLKALLIASINEVRSTYGLPGVPIQLDAAGPMPPGVRRIR